jgi:hypothetical protein
MLPGQEKMFADAVLNENLTLVMKPFHSIINLIQHILVNF